MDTLRAGNRRASKKPGKLQNKMKLQAITVRGVELMMEPGKDTLILCDQVQIGTA